MWSIQPPQRALSCASSVESKKVPASRRFAIMTFAQLLRHCRKLSVLRLAARCAEKTLCFLYLVSSRLVSSRLVLSRLAKLVYGVPVLWGDRSGSRWRERDRPYLDMLTMIKVTL